MLLQVIGPASGVCLVLGSVFLEVAHRGPSLIGAYPSTLNMDAAQILLDSYHSSSGIKLILEQILFSYTHAHTHHITYPHSHNIPHTQPHTSHNTPPPPHTHTHGCKELPNGHISFLALLLSVQTVISEIIYIYIYIYIYIRRL